VSLEVATTLFNQRAVPNEVRNSERSKYCDEDIVNSHPLISPPERRRKKNVGEGKGKERRDKEKED
jgi:hypothetical protein